MIRSLAGPLESQRHFFLRSIRVAMQDGIDGGLADRHGYLHDLVIAEAEFRGNTVGFLLGTVDRLQGGV